MLIQSLKYIYLNIKSSFFYIFFRKNNIVKKLSFYNRCLLCLLIVILRFKNILIKLAVSRLFFSKKNYSIIKIFNLNLMMNVLNLFFAKILMKSSII